MFKSVRVLIVEDDPECAKVLYRYTETLGFTVKAVSSLRMAMSEVSAADILVLDLKVNGGLVSTDSLMEDWTAAGRGPLCVVADDEINRDELIQSGACNVLVKPIQKATYTSIMTFYAKYTLFRKRVEELETEMKEMKEKLAEDVKKQSKKIWIVVGIAVLSMLLGGAGGLPQILEFLQTVL